jgi:hypothetical protein
LKEVKSPELAEDTIFVKAAQGHQLLIRLISRLIEGWDHANAKISFTEDSQSGGGCKRITITLDAGTSEQSETTSSTKS